MSEKGKDRHGNAIHQDSQGYYTTNHIGQRIETDIHGEPIQDFSSYNSQEDAKTTLDYKGGNIFVKILMIILKIFTGFIKAIAKIASNLTFGK